MNILKMFRDMAEKRRAQRRNKNFLASKPVTSGSITSRRARKRRTRQHHKRIDRALPKPK